VNGGASDQSRAADRWLLGLGVALWVVAVITLVAFHLGVETVVSRNEATARNASPEVRALPSMQAMPAVHSRLRLARSLPAIALPVALVGMFLARRSRRGISVGTLVGLSGLFVGLCTMAGLLWVAVLSTSSV